VHVCLLPHTASVTKTQCMIEYCVRRFPIPQGSGLRRTRRLPDIAQKAQTRARSIRGVVYAVLRCTTRVEVSTSDPGLEQEGRMGISPFDEFCEEAQGDKGVELRPLEPVYLATPIGSHQTASA